MNAPLGPKLDAALAFAKRGIKVFPCNKKKRPRTNNGFKAATSDPEQIREFWKRWPDAEIGIATGLVSGIVVIDIDVDLEKEVDGRTWLAEMVAAHGPLPPTPTASTPRGGIHLYFAAPDLAVPSTAGKLAEGVDVRGDGGYVLVDPSSTERGQYKWITPLLDAPLPLMPDWLLDLLMKKGSPASVLAQGDSNATLINPEDAKAAVVLVGDAAKEVEIARQGKRNATLNRSAFLCGRLVAARAVDEAFVRDALLKAAAAAGLEDREIDRTLNSGLTAGKRRPWRPYAFAPELGEINRNHFYALDGKAGFVFCEETDPLTGFAVVGRIYPGAFKELHGNVHLLWPGRDGKPKLRKLGEVWMEWDGRRQYRRIAFAPGIDLPSSTYNLWQGFAVQPQPGDWSKLHEFLLNTICGGERALFDYLIGWCAYAVQFPSKPGEVAIVMRGEKGVGKTFFATHFGEIFGAHFVKLANAKHLVGNFNAHFEAAIFVFADEAFWAGDKQNESVLKDLVTAHVIRIEQKGVDSKSVPNRVHLMMASNADWVVPATAGERRYLVLDVSAARQQDTQYFAQLDHEWSNGGREAFMAHLLEVDLTEFDVRKAPSTSAMRDQKLLTFEPVQKWYFEMLMQGQNNDKRWQDWVETSVLWGSFKEFCDDQKLRTGSKEAFGMGLQGLIPPRTGNTSPRRQRTVGPYRVWGYEFPTVDKCREYFDKKMGEAFEWDESPRSARGRDRSKK